jgi:hypothetical protein
MAEKITFSFGKNWYKFLDTINDSAIKEAEKSISDFMDMHTFKEKTFLDVGCGSWLFSYITYRLAAKKLLVLILIHSQ